MPVERAMTKYDVRINEAQRHVMLEALREFRRQHPERFADCDFDTCVLIDCIHHMPIDEWHGPGRVHDLTPPDLLNHLH